MFHRYFRILTGALIWGAFAVAAASLLVSVRGKEASTFSRLARYFGQEERRLKVTFPEPLVVEVGDTVMLAGPGGRNLGEVEALLDENGKPLTSVYAWCSGVRLRLFDVDEALIRADAKVLLVRVPQTAAWVLQTLLTPENLPLVAEEWNKTMLEHREEIFEMLTPVVRDLILDVERHVESELPGFLERHRSGIQELSEQVRQDFLASNLVDYLVNNLWPISQPRLQPIIEKVSREIWEKLPLWGLTWRFAYQNLPFTANDHVEKAWVLFLNAQVIPVFKAHAGEILDALRDVARTILAREEVATQLRRTFEGLLQSPRFQSLSQVFLREVILDNPRFQEAMSRRWRSPELRRALEAATAHIEPMARRMGDIVFGTREKGITKEFARVIRSQILLKDLEYLVLDPGSDKAPPFDPRRPLRATVQWEVPRR